MLLYAPWRHYPFFFSKENPKTQQKVMNTNETNYPGKKKAKEQTLCIERSEKRVCKTLQIFQNTDAVMHVGS